VTDIREMNKPPRSELREIYAGENRGSRYRVGGAHNFENGSKEEMEILKDFWGFLKERKKWWLLPMIVMLLLMGLLIMSSGSAVAPFIYTLF